MDRESLADFLRNRRNALTPSDIGLPAGYQRRQVRGLRREEVAQLVGMSVDYYSRLEQGRGPQPSVRMLAALARALRLDQDECDHLYRLGGHSAPERTNNSSYVRPPLVRVLDQLDECAAFICSDLLVCLAQNRLSVLLMGDHMTGAGIENSVTWRWFTDPRYRAMFPVEDHEHQARLSVADLRSTWTRRRDDPEVSALVDALLQRSEEFRMLWSRHEVGPRTEVCKTMVHPRLGPITLDCEVLSIAGSGQRMVILSAPAASESYHKLKHLNELGDHGGD